MLAALIATTFHPVSAVELGALKVDSYLNQPLKAVLPVNDVSALDLADIRFRLANYSAYERLNLARPTGLDALQFKLTAAENRRYDLHITSRNRMVEPILDLVIHVEEKQGDFYRHFTLFIDPPGSPLLLTSPAEPVLTATAPLQTASKQLPASPNARDLVPRGSETVLVTDRSISIIAENSYLYDKYSVYQIMRAFYLENPGAFTRGNIDKLISGKRLKVPAESLVAEVPRSEAVQFVFARSKDYPDAGGIVARGPEEPGKPAAAEEMLDQPMPTSQTLPKPADQSAPVEEPAPGDEALQAPVVAIENPTVGALRQDIAQQQALLQELSQRLDQIRSEISVEQASVQTDSLPQEIPPLAQIPVPIEQLAERTPGAQEPATIEQQTRSKPPIAVPEVATNSVREPEAQIEPTPLAASGQQPQVLLETGPNERVGPSNQPVSAAEIVTYPEQSTAPSSQSWWQEAILLAMLILLALREWVWRRRLQTHPVQVEKPQKPSTYAPSKKVEDHDALELKHIGSKRKKQSAETPVTTRKSKIRRQATNPEAVNIETQILIAYEQYEEALELLEAARQKFGQVGWIDLKTLEIYAATKQCGPFLELFNQRRVKLEEESPIAWEKIAKMRDSLCKEFNISAIG